MEASSVEAVDVEEPSQSVHSHLIFLRSQEKPVGEGGGGEGVGEGERGKGASGGRGERAGAGGTAARRWRAPVMASRALVEKSTSPPEQVAQASTIMTLIQSPEAPDSWPCTLMHLPQSLSWKESVGRAAYMVSLQGSGRGWGGVRKGVGRG